MPVNNVESRFRQNNNVNNNLQGDIITAVMGVPNGECAIAYSTEAVPGIGCDPDSETAVIKLLELKRHSVDKELILTATNYEQLKPYIDDTMLTDTQRETIFSRWPGPVTFVFPAPVTTPCWLTGRFDSLAVRITNHPLVAALCQAYGEPLISTGANLSGLSPYRIVDEAHVRFGTALPVVPDEMEGRLDLSETRDALAGELFRQG